jgi:hypothetical protein
VQFKKTFDSVEFQHTLHNVLRVTRAVWHGDCHVEMVDGANGNGVSVLIPHNIENFGVKYTPSADDVCADDWCEYTDAPKIVLI